MPQAQRLLGVPPCSPAAAATMEACAARPPNEASLSKMSMPVLKGGEECMHSAGKAERSTEREKGAPHLPVEAAEGRAL